MSLPILPTTVVGSYSMPGWLERLKTEYFARRISRQELDEIHDAAVKAAVKDQEVPALVAEHLGKRRGCGLYRWRLYTPVSRSPQ